MTDTAAPLVAPHLVPLEGPPPADIIAGPQTDRLAGMLLEYEYTSGRVYRLTFTAEKVTFKMLSAPNWKENWAVPVSLPYLAREVRDDLIMVHWLVPGRSGHVTVLVDLALKKVHASALMPFKMEMFDIADITRVGRNDDEPAEATGAGER